MHLVLMGTFPRQSRAPNYPSGASDEDLLKRLAVLEEDDWASATTRNWRASRSGHPARHRGGAVVHVVRAARREPAVRCASAIVASVRDLGVEVRAGVHTGEIERSDASVRGIAVDIGACIAAIARPGEVLVSSTVKDIVAGSGIGFEEHGERELAGIPGTWRLFAAAPGVGGRAAARRPRRSQESRGTV